jgi:hypothetical protein
VSRVNLFKKILDNAQNWRVSEMSEKIRDGELYPEKNMRKRELIFP